MGGEETTASRWLWLARLVAHPSLRTWLVRGIVIGAAVVLVLGIWGWLDLGRADPNDDVEVGIVTAVYRSLAFFAGEAGEAYDVKWQLQLARLSALGVSLSGLILAGLSRLRDAIERRGAATASGHRVFVGDVRACRVRLGAERSVSELTTLGVANSRRAGGEVHVDLAPVESWATRSAAVAADEVVIAGLPDGEAIEIANRFLVSHPDFAGRVLVDLADGALAQQIDLLFARDYPRVNVSVGSLTTAVVVGAAERLISDRSESGAIVLAGEDESLISLTNFLTAFLERRYIETFAADAEDLYVIDDVGLQFETRHTVAVQRIRSDQPSALDDATAGEVFVVGRDKSARAKLIADLRLRYPALDVNELEFGALTETRALSAASFGEQILRGPLWSLESAEPYFLGGGHDASKTRAVVGELATAGFHLVPATSTARSELSEEDAGRLVDLVDVTLEDAMNSRARLRSVGLDFRQQEWPMLRRILEPVIADLAKRQHDEYLEHVRAKNEFDPDNRGAHRPWDELTDEFRHSNTDQALHSLTTKIDLLGVTVVDDVDAEGALTEISEAEIEMLAKAEHDRWAQNRRDHGWEYADIPVPDDAARLHPQLRDWDDLPEAEREKDRIPCRRLIADLRRHGLALVRS